MPGDANSGRSRKPTARLKLRGTYRRDRQGGRFDDSRRPAELPKTKGMSNQAAALWDSLGLDLTWLRRPDWPLFQAGCEACAAWKAGWHSSDAIKRREAHEALKLFVAIAAKLGMTPVDRARLAAEPKPNAGAFEAGLAREP